MKSKINYYLRWLILCFLSGLLSGSAASLFLRVLDWATQFQNSNRMLLFGLPLIGFFIVWVNERWGQDVKNGSSVILKEIHHSQKRIPLRLTPLIFLGTILTHLFGGSAGREGTAIQMGASLSDQLTQLFTLTDKERSQLLSAGAAAGFGAAIGTPWAGFLFGMEFIFVNKLKVSFWFQSFVASFVGYGTTLVLKAPHTHYPMPEIPNFSFSVLFFVALAALCFGSASQFFTHTTKWFEKSLIRFVSYPPLRPVLGGILVLLLFYGLGTFEYVGLGLPQIKNAIEEPVSLMKPFFKSIATTLTIGSGFKGGEFTPLVFIGATLGSALSQILPLSFSFLAALGFASVFAGASNTPIACAVMAIEFFGPGMAPYALLSCYLSYSFSGSVGIYQNQENSDPHPIKLLNYFRAALKVFIKK